MRKFYGLRPNRSSISELGESFRVFTIDHKRFREDVLDVLGKIHNCLISIEMDSRSSDETLRSVQDRLERIDDGMNPSAPDDEFPILKG